MVALQARYANGKRIENAFQTNGVLLNDEWGEFFAASDPVRLGEERYTAELLQAVPVALCLQRGMPEASLCDDAGRRVGTELSLRGI